MSSKPNILLILTDQHRLSALGCYGPTPFKTQRTIDMIDRFVADDPAFAALLSDMRNRLLEFMLEQNHPSTHLYSMSRIGTPGFPR